MKDSPRSVESFLIEMVNQKYAKRVFQKMNTEWEALTIEHGSEPGIKEYEWMLGKALAIHRELNVEGDGDAKEAADQVSDRRGDS